MNETTITPRATVCVATPMYGGMCTGLYTKSMLRLQTTLAAENIALSFVYSLSESLITRGRNTLVHMFLREQAATHLLFIDADISFEPSDVVRMVDADLDILCGAYPRKEINWERVKAAALGGVEAADLKFCSAKYVLNSLNPEEKPEWDTPIEMKHCGTGFMMIKRAVFDRLADKVPEYRETELNWNGEAGSPEMVKEYFATSIEPGTQMLLSEDWHFCHIARQNGIKVHAAPWVTLSHVGTHVFLG